jgi:hypothetical protein
MDHNGPFALDQAVAQIVKKHRDTRWPDNPDLPVYPDEDAVWDDMQQLGFQSVLPAGVNYVYRRVATQLIDAALRDINVWGNRDPDGRAERLRRALESSRPAPLEFVITIRPVRRLSPCAQWWERNREGMPWRHDTEKCSDCVIKPDGFELHGENGHIQGRLDEPPTEEWMGGYDARLHRDTRLNKTVFVVSDRGYTYIQ